MVQKYPKVLLTSAQSSMIVPVHFQLGLLSSCNSATGYTSTLVENLYWGLFASSSANFITAIFILFFESVFH